MRHFQQAWHDRWVEQGEAPQRVLASRVSDGSVERTRPLCAYPQVAQYRGVGDINDAENFLCSGE
uniref:tannase/feruloyl esterase family alpha/beta hydrolase n=1 Tax=Mesorhizobium neociceri TaxID=1307853 RepID=UPI0038B3FB83